MKKEKGGEKGEGREPLEERRMSLVSLWKWPVEKVRMEPVDFLFFMEKGCNSQEVFVFKRKLDQVQIPRRD